MAKTNAFKLAQLIRVFQYNTTDDVIETAKRTTDHNTSRGNATKTATAQFNLGDMYEEGHGVKQSYEKAEKQGVAQAQVNQSRCHVQEWPWREAERC